MRPDWVNEDVAEAPRLNAQQAERLLKMTELLRADPANIYQVLRIKEAFNHEDAMELVNLWSGFTDDEQQTLYIAPKYGGIFTTAERKAIKTGVIE